LNILTVNDIDSLVKKFLDSTLDSLDFQLKFPAKPYQDTFDMVDVMHTDYLVEDKAFKYKTYKEKLEDALKSNDIGNVEKDILKIFLEYGFDAPGDNSASEECIILNRQIRDKINTIIPQEKQTTNSKKLF
jgi:hypothetical protein